VITPALLDELGVRITKRPFGYVILTSAAGKNTEAFRIELQAWLTTPEGVAWLSSRAA
jgi:hypothetical protein